MICSPPESNSKHVFCSLKWASTYCIMHRHELALDHAKLSCKSCYNMVFDLQIILYQKLNSLVSSQNKNKTNYNAAYAPESEIAI